MPMFNFGFDHGFIILRLICGLFFIPHIYGKFFVPAALDFFKAANFKPPAFWMYVACVVEVVIAIGLILGIYTPYAAALGALQLTIAGVATLKVNKGKWLWNIGGAEYPFFWALACLVVAFHTWPAM